MGRWSYRMTRREFAGETEYGIREVYYEGDKITGWTADIVGASGETAEELLEVLERMHRDAVDLKILDITDEDNPKEI
jgi:hypothetical protein